MCETSKRPACSRVHRCSFSTPVGVLHRHVVAARTATMRAPAARWASVSGVVLSAWSVTAGEDSGDGRGRPDIRPVRSSPPLSCGLRDSGLREAALAPSASRPDPSSPAALSSVHLTPAVLLPERFRGGCAFGSEHETRPLPRESTPKLVKAGSGVKRVSALVLSVTSARASRCPAGQRQLQLAPGSRRPAPGGKPRTAGAALRTGQAA